MGLHYFTEFSDSVVLATVTSALAGMSATDSGAKDVLLEVEYLLDTVDDLRDEDSPTAEEILNMDVNRLESNDEVSEGRFFAFGGRENG